MSKKKQTMPIIIPNQASYTGWFSSNIKQAEESYKEHIAQKRVGLTSDRIEPVNMPVTKANPPIIRSSTRRANYPNIHQVNN